MSIIGLTASPSGPFNAIVQFGKATNGILLGTSIFAFILDIVWIAALVKKQKSNLFLDQSLLNPDLPDNVLKVRYEQTLYEIEKLEKNLFKRFGNQRAFTQKGFSNEFK